jgi:hypothetical protein
VRAEEVDAGPHGVLRLVLDHAEPDAGRGRVLIDGVALPQWVEGDAGAGVDVAVPPGAHTVLFEHEGGGDPSEFNVIVRADSLVTLALGSARCSGIPPLGGVAPPPPTLRGGCCGGTHQLDISTVSSGGRGGAALGVGIACVAAVGRRRKTRGRNR